MPENISQVRIHNSIPGWEGLHFANGEGAVTKFIKERTVITLIKGHHPVVDKNKDIGKVFPHGVLDSFGKPIMELISPPDLPKILEGLEKEGYHVQDDVWNAIQASLGT